MPISADEYVGDLVKSPVNITQGLDAAEGLGRLPAVESPAELALEDLSWWLWLVEEGARQGQGGAINHLSGGDVGVLLGGDPEPKEDQGQLIIPVSASTAGSEGVLQSPVHPLDHPVGLGVKCGRHDVVNPQGLAQGGPDRRRELGTSVRGEGSWNSKTTDPVAEKGVEALSRGGGAHGDHLRPPGAPVDDGEVMLVNPLEDFSGPTRSIWMWEKCLAGTGMDCSSVLWWRRTLVAWQGRQSLALVKFTI